VERTLATPDGTFTIVAGPDAVLASGWIDDAANLFALIHPSLRPESRGAGSAEVLDQACEAAEAYYSGDFAAPAQISVRQHSGPYRSHAWNVLRKVEVGDIVSYREYAALTGRPAAVRAAANACASNAAALFVPCHRVLRSDGSLGGFRYGLHIKKSLLDRETESEPPAAR